MERLEVTETFAGIALPGHLHTAESLQFATSFPFRDTDVVIVTYPKSGEWHWVGRGWDGMGGSDTQPSLLGGPGAACVARSWASPTQSASPSSTDPQTGVPAPQPCRRGCSSHTLHCCSPVPATSPPSARSKGWGLEGAVLLYCTTSPAVPCATLHCAV